MDIRRTQNEQAVLLGDILPVIMVCVTRRMLVAENRQVLRAGFAAVRDLERPGAGISQLLHRLCYQLRSETVTPIGGLQDCRDRSGYTGRSARYKGLKR